MRNISRGGVGSIRVTPQNRKPNALLTVCDSLSSLRASEGRTVEVPYRGDVENTIRDVLGGLRSTCTYVGAAKLKELSRRTTFIRVTQQSSHMFT